MRYWAVVGCYLLQDKDVNVPLDAIRAAANDKVSDHVRLMAAWTLYRGGDKTSAQNCINDLLANSSYASLKAFNVVDLIGDGIEPYRESMAKCTFDHQGYVNRMKQYLGVEEHPETDPRQQKKKNRKKK